MSSMQYGDRTRRIACSAQAACVAAHGGLINGLFTTKCAMADLSIQNVLKVARGSSIMHTCFFLIALLSLPSPCSSFGKLVAHAAVHEAANEMDSSSTTSSSSSSSSGDGDIGTYVMVGVAICIGLAICGKIVEACEDDDSSSQGTSQRLTAPAPAPPAWCKKDVYAKSTKHEGKVGQLTMNPDSDGDVKLLWANGTISSYIKAHELVRAPAPAPAPAPMQMTPQYTQSQQYNPAAYGNLGGAALGAPQQQYTPPTMATYAPAPTPAITTGSMSTSRSPIKFCGECGASGPPGGFTCAFCTECGQRL
jgi:hypothetical protein